MIGRRLATLVALPALVAPARATAPPAARHCGDPGGRFIACAEAARGLPPREAAPARCPLCGGRHATAAP